MDATLAKFLSEFKASSPLFPNDLGVVSKVTIHSTIPQIFKKLIDEKIQSVPVVDDNGVAICVISMMHLLEHLLDHFSEEEFKNNDIYELTLKEELKEHSDLREVAHPAFSMSEHASILEVVKVMKKEKVHRILVTDMKGHLVNVITQFRIVQMMSMILDSIQTTKKSLEQLKLDKKPVWSVLESESVLSAFKKIKEQRVYSVAVVNEHGSLVGNISANDLKLLGYDISFFKLLGEKVGQYLATIHATATAEEDRPTVITAKPSDTLANVIRLLIFYRVHRVFVVDTENRPIGVVSLQDIIETLIQ